MKHPILDLSKAVGWLLSRLAAGRRNAVADDLWRTLAQWAEEARAGGAEALADALGGGPERLPMTPIGPLVQAAVTCRRALRAGAWELGVEALVVSDDEGGRRARRRRVTWDVPWSELPAPVREELIRSADATARVEVIALRGRPERGEPCWR